MAANDNGGSGSARRPNGNDTRRATKEWDPWLVVPETGPSTASRACIFCGWNPVFVRKRAFGHFGYNQRTGTERCKKIPFAVLQKFRACQGVVPKGMTFEETYAVPEGPVPMEEEVLQPTGGVDENKEEEPSATNEPLNPLPDSVESTPTVIERRSTPTMSRQMSMDESMQIALRVNLDKMWASFFYEANIAFNVARHPAFIKAVKETAASGLRYQPPSFNALRTKWIEPKRVEVAKMVSDRTKHSIENYGATICSDGWSDTNSRPLLNVMLVCPAGDVFLGSVDTSGEKKDITYTTNTMAQYIEEVGPQNIVQLCTDNAAVMTGAMRSLQERYPHMYMQGCAAHILDLLLEDWAKEARVKQIVKRCSQIVKFIKKYHVTLALFRKYSPTKALRLPNKTRFAVNFLMVSRVVECKQALVRVIMDETFTPFEESLFQRQNGILLRERARKAREDIHLESFWIECDNFIHMVEPVLDAL